MTCCVLKIALNGGGRVGMFFFFCSLHSVERF
jgi:hypothetical protein